MNCSTDFLCKVNTTVQHIDYSIFEHHFLYGACGDNCWLVLVSHSKVSLLSIFRFRRFNFCGSSFSVANAETRVSFGKERSQISAVLRRLDTYRNLVFQLLKTYPRCGHMCFYLRRRNGFIDASFRHPSINALQTILAFKNWAEKDSDKRDCVSSRIRMRIFPFKAKDSNRKTARELIQKGYYLCFPTKATL